MTYDEWLQHLTTKFQCIWESALQDLQEENYQAPIFTDHIHYIDDEKFTTYFKPLQKEDKLNIIVMDYISGMSDKYFSDTYHDIQHTP